MRTITLLATMAAAAMAQGDGFLLEKSPTILVHGAHYQATMEQENVNNGQLQTMKIGASFGVSLLEGADGHQLFELRFQRAWIEGQGTQQDAPLEYLPVIHVAADGDGRALRLFVGDYLRKLLRLVPMETPTPFPGRMGRLVQETRQKFITELSIFAIEEISEALLASPSESMLPVGYPVFDGWGVRESSESPLWSESSKLDYMGQENGCAIFASEESSASGAILSPLGQISQRVQGETRVLPNGQVWSAKAVIEQATDIRVGQPMANSSRQVLKIERISQ